MIHKYCQTSVKTHNDAFLRRNIKKIESLGQSMSKDFLFIKNVKSIFNV